jgi:hypothetical protein
MVVMMVGVGVTMRVRVRMGSDMRMGRAVVRQDRMQTF